MSGLKTVPLSVLIPVRNEASNVEECVRSVSFADDVVVVDSESSDGTVDKARALGARVVQFRWDGGYPRKKNWALEHVDWKNDWVLIVDADERITEALAAEIAETLQAPRNDGYYVNRRFFFMGGWLKHSGYYPSWNLRLFRHAKGRYERIDAGHDGHSGDNEVHEHVILDGTAGYLRNDMLHYAYPDIHTWVEKHNRYSDWEARVARSTSRDEQNTLSATPFGSALERKRWLRQVGARLPLRPTLRFLYHYIWKQGFRDGYRGFVLCRLLGWYEFLSVAKARELQHRRNT